ncbi:MAG TPA: SDR family oxidoreductase [Nitrososphaerales archaeon]|nr:SDR family oxidoreductase [Nitrososphaerales archaeon]
MLEGKTCLVTGANSGLGRETALALARMKANVVMVCRDKGKGDAARREISKESGNESVDLLLCDLSSLAEVRTLAAEVRNRYGKLHVLVNNAGLFSFSGKTPDGFETTFAVDYLAPFLLTNLLLELLKASAPSRIVNVSSVAHFSGHIDFDAIRRGGGVTGWGAYSNSKLALVMFTYELARRLQGTGVTANCLHPGGVATNIWRIPAALTRPFLKSAKEGAQTSIYLASSPDVESASGKYFENEKEKKSSEESYDEKKALELWDETSKIVGLST